MDSVKFTFFEKVIKIEKIFTVNVTVCSNRQIDGEDFVNFCGLLTKHELKNLNSCHARFELPHLAKGQLIWKGHFDFFNSPKKRTKSFCPSRLGQ